MKIVSKRPSNRVYEKKICLQCVKSFIPTDARQKFCVEQHRVDYHNDQRKIKDAPIRRLTFRILKNEAILGKIFMLIERHGSMRAFHKNLLDFEEYDFEISHERGINNESKNEIEWFFQYGLEVADIEQKTFIVHKRKYTC